MLDETFVNALIRGQYRSKHIYALLAGASSSVGLGGIVWLLLSRREAQLLSLLPIVVSALALVPWKEIRICNEKIDTLQLIKARLQGLSSVAIAADTERTRIEELLWRCVEKTVAG
jgi:hypothetical protein